MPESDLVDVISALIENPIMLFYEIKVNEEPSRFIYKEGDVEMVFDDHDEQKQYDEDQEMAKKLQQQMDDEEEKKYNKYSSKRKESSENEKEKDEVDLDSDKPEMIAELADDEWKCES
jgi:hypothetical protein